MRPENSVKWMNIMASGRKTGRNWADWYPLETSPASHFLVTLLVGGWCLDTMPLLLPNLVADRNHSQTRLKLRQSLYEGQSQRHTLKYFKSLIPRSDHLRMRGPSEQVSSVIPATMNKETIFVQSICVKDHQCSSKERDLGLMSTV